MCDAESSLELSLAWNFQGLSLVPEHQNGAPKGPFFPTQSSHSHAVEPTGQVACGKHMGCRFLTI